MSDLLGQPVFILGLVVLVAGATGAAISFSGVEIGAITAGRSVVASLLGLAIMLFAWWSTAQDEFTVRGLSIRWDTSNVIMCSSDQTYTASIQTAGKPKTIRYRVVAGERILKEGEVTPDGAGITSVTGRAHLDGTSLPILSSDRNGTEIHVELLSPVTGRSAESRMGTFGTCGFVDVTPLP
jgi:hypothetical protein